MYMPADVPVEALLGTIAEGPLDWENDITENPLEGDTEIWRISNFTPDAHPIHLHLVNFQVLDRIPFDKEAFVEAEGKWIGGGKSRIRLIPLTLPRAIRCRRSRGKWAGRIPSSPIRT